MYGLCGPGHFTPTLENERPLNVYGFSKLAFDHYFRDQLALGTGADDGGGSALLQCVRAARAAQGAHGVSDAPLLEADEETGKVRLFAGTGGYGDGEQRRDFVYVRDLARLNMFFRSWDRMREGRRGAKMYRGVVNAGTGVSRSFNAVARALMTVHGEADRVRCVSRRSKGRYQHFTEADLTGLRRLGCD